MTTDTGTAAQATARWADLPQLPVLEPEYQNDPHRFYRQAREQSPLAFGMFGPAALSYDAVHTVLRDRRFASAKALNLEVSGITSGPLWDQAVRSILSLDGEEHHRLRRLVSKAFTPTSAARLRAAMAEVINGLIDPFSAAGRCDIVGDIARPYPIPIICELLGAPRQDWRLFSAWTDDIFKIFGPNVVSDEPDIVRATGELRDYVEHMVARRRETLSDDLISNLIRAEEDGDRLTHDELLMLVSAVLTAGTDTTRNQLAAAVQVFCEHPDQWTLLAERPELAPQAVEEVMRHTPIIFGAPRIATEDVDLAGVMVPAGTFVMAITASANRDPAVYPDPDKFDITREHPDPMLTFGGGIHYCLGVHLAKAELAVALVAMAGRMPNIRRTGPAPWKPVLGISGPITLPVEFEPGH